jgi:plastocyanin
MTKNSVARNAFTNRLRASAMAAVVATLLSVVVVSASAASLSVTSIDKIGAVMPDVVIYATPVGAGAAALPPLSEDGVTISQERQQFTPYVTVVRKGTSIRFPNYDKIEHHVKSFSPAKEFEIKIYESGTPPPVVFDKPGVVVVYCLLHEWMRAYVLIVDTPYFSKTDASGAANLNGLKEGTYEIRAWHPDMGSVKPPLLQTVKVSEKGMAPIQFAFDFLPKKRKPSKLK